MFLDGRLEEVAAQKDAEDRFGDGLGIEGAANFYTRLAAVRASHYLGHDITEMLSYFPHLQRGISVREELSAQNLRLVSFETFLDERRS